MKREDLKMLSRFFGFCSLFGLVLVYLWFFLYECGNYICNVSLRFFEMSQHECAMVNYTGIAILKILVLVFFLFPWIAIRIELMRKK